MHLHAHRHLHAAVACRLAAALAGCVGAAAGCTGEAIGPLAPTAAAAANAATHLGGNFSISPARRTVVAQPPVDLSSTRVANTTADTLRVRAYPVLLAQSPSGALTFDPTSTALARAERVLEVAPSRFTLTPNGALQVALRWRSLPHGARTAAVGVVYQATPPREGAAVQTVERLLGVDILSLPGALRRSDALTGLHVAQQAPGVLRFTAGVRNTGQAVAGPRRLELTIRGRGNTPLVHRPIATDIVLPGATRNFAVDLAQRLPAGRYTASASVDYGAGGHSGRASLPFTLAGAGALTAPHVQVGLLTARGTVGAGAQITATLANTGTAAAHPVIELRMVRLAGGGLAGSARRHGERTERSVAAHRRVTTSALAPGARRRLQISLGRLQPGTYVLSATYRDANGTPQTLVTDFQAQPSVPPFTQVRQWLQRHPLLAPLLTSGLGLALIGLLLVRIRQLQHHTRASN